MKKKEAFGIIGLIVLAYMIDTKVEFPLGLKLLALQSLPKFHHIFVDVFGSNSSPEVLTVLIVDV
jgi:hypothetical protein